MLSLKCTDYTYRVVKAFKPLKASCAIREMLLFDKLMRRKRLKCAKAFAGSSVMKFCSKRLLNKKTDSINFIRIQLESIKFHKFQSIKQ